MPGKKRLKMLLALAICWAITVVIPPWGAGATQGQIQVMEGRLTDIHGKRITLEGYYTLEPANEHAVVPEWAREGLQVKVGYYVQGYTSYYLKIVKPEESFPGEEEQRTRAPQ